jgi:diguanylate cyclase (GGDEF)-like protein
MFPAHRSSLLTRLRRLWFPPPELGQRLLKDHRLRIAICLLVGGPAGFAFWFRDWARDPAGAQDTLLLRLVFLLAVPMGLGMLKARRPWPAAAMLHAGLACMLAADALSLTHLRDGMEFGIGGFVGYYFFAMFLLPGLPPLSSLIFALEIPLVPHLMALAGWLPGFPHMAFAMQVWATSVCTVVMGAVLARGEQRRYELEQLLAVAANTDPLTGISNRRHFTPALNAELERARRHSQPLAVLMLDIDHFKQINDRYGHAAGDETIRCLAQLCRQSLRSFDLVARLGGEEFALMLPSTDLKSALAAAERLRQQAALLQVVGERGERFDFTVSIGVAAMAPGDDASALLARADKGLYRAKQTGRNRVCINLYTV